MRMDSTLNVTSEGSLNDILTASRGNVDLMEVQKMLEAPEQEIVGNCPSATMSDRAVETPYTSVKVLPERTPDGQMSRLTDMPRRVEHMREASHENALVSARHFFAPENGQDQGILQLMEPPLKLLHLLLPAQFLLLPLPQQQLMLGMGSPSSFLHNNSPSRPTATATCRP